MDIPQADDKQHGITDREPPEQEEYERQEHPPHAEKESESRPYRPPANDAQKHPED